MPVNVAASRPKKSCRRLGDRAAEAREPGRVVGVGRRRDQRRPGRVRRRRGVAVARGLVDRGDRPPEHVARLVTPRHDRRIGGVRVRAREHPRVVGHGAALGVRDRAQDARHRRGGVARAPVLRRERLVDASGSRSTPSRSSLTSLKSAAYARVWSACGGRPRNRSGSRSTNGLTSFSQAAGSLTPLVGRHSPGRVPTGNVNGAAGKRPSPARAAIMLGRGGHAGGDAALARRSGRDPGERVRVGRLDQRDARGGEPGRAVEPAVEQHVARGGRDGGLLRVPRLGRGRGDVRLVAAGDRVDRVVDGAVDHRQVHARDGALAGAGWCGGSRRLECRGGGRVPVGDGVRTRGRGERERGEQDESGEQGPACAVAHGDSFPSVGVVMVGLHPPSSHHSRFGAASQPPPTRRLPSR